MSAFKLICYFSSHPAAFAFQASSSPDSITLNPINMKTALSIYDFHTGKGAAA